MRKLPPPDEAYEIGRALLRIQNNEDCAVLILRIALHLGEAEKLLGCPKIRSHRHEVTLGPGRVDVVLFHEDESITLVEVKGDTEVRQIVGGIGQLFLYEAHVPHSLPSLASVKIHKTIACTAPPERAALAIRACHIAGVHYACLGTFHDLKRILAEVSDHGA